MTQTDYLSLPLRGFLDEVAARQPAPGGGAASAVAVGLGAGLVAMAAAFSTEHLDDADQIVTAAEKLRAQAAPLADQDAAVYGEVLTAMRLPKDTADRGARLQAALSAAADVPVQVVRIGAEVAQLASRLQEHGNPNLRGDALTGRLLATAATQSAAALVLLNLSDHSDPRVIETAALASRVALPPLPPALPPSS